MRKMFEKKARRKAEAMEIDITSLLDILVILLVFLLKSYNSTNLTLDLAKKIKLPSSKSRVLGSHAVIIQVDKKKQIYIKNKRIGQIHKSAKIDVLYDYLKRERSIASKKVKTPSKQINLVLHKDLPYDAIKKVMHTSASAGFTDFKFIVTGNY